MPVSGKRTEERGLRRKHTRHIQWTSSKQPRGCRGVISKEEGGRWAQRGSGIADCEGHFKDWHLLWMNCRFLSKGLKVLSRILRHKILSFSPTRFTYNTHVQMVNAICPTKDTLPSIKYPTTVSHVQTSPKRTAPGLWSVCVWPGPFLRRLAIFAIQHPELSFSECLH